MRALAVLMAAAMVLAGCATASDPGGAAEPTAIPTPGCEETRAYDRDADVTGSIPLDGEIDAAWLCVYSPSDVWTLVDGPATIEDTDALRALVDGFEPADPGAPCTMELGPEYLVTAVSGTEVTSIVLEAYGCRWARLDGSADVFSTPDGAIADLEALAGL
ncbi:hypothetical protein [Demequina phytophila]|uniref:hypothetical protein n=1 Tax=Demequina phytophila TaxID=1638981 RepID=UPI000785786F|nr:hypothetical protein [Demequina phytophila]